VFQDEILVEILLVHFVDFCGVHKANDLADTIDRLTIVDSYTISHPSPYLLLRLSGGHEGGRTKIRTSAELCKPRRSIMLNQGCTGDLTLAKVLASNGFISRGGLAVELSFTFLLFFELADLAIFFLFTFRLHIHRGRRPFAFRRVGLVLGQASTTQNPPKTRQPAFFFSPFAKRFALYSSSFWDFSLFQPRAAWDPVLLNCKLR